VSKLNLGDLQLVGIRPVPLNPTMGPPPKNVLLDLSTGEKGIIVQDEWIDDEGVMWARIAVLLPREPMEMEDIVDLPPDDELDEEER
jgi:hypothetical protein